jgi:hypothetical protein
MRSDEELERLVEDWLEAQARPMPPAVLEDTLETIARTGQQDRPSLVGGWFTRPIGLAAAAVLLLLVVVGGDFALNRSGWFGASPAISPGQGQVWDPAVDFGRWSNRLNPSPDSYGNEGVWSYLSSAVVHTPVAYAPLPLFEDGQWKEPSRVAAYLGQGGILMSPWKGPDFEHFAVLAWKSPIAGRVAIHGTFALVQDECTGSGIDFYVDRGSESLLVTRVTTGGRDAFDLDTRVAVGDSVYFIIGAGSTSSCDFTLLKLVITG